MPPTKDDLEHSTTSMLGKNSRRRRRLPKTCDKENNIEETKSSTKSCSAPTRKQDFFEEQISVDFHSPSLSTQTNTRPNFGLERFHQAQIAIAESDIWRRKSSLAELVVRTSQGSQQVHGALLLEENSIELLNVCRKCLKAAASEGDATTDKFSYLCVAIHGLRAISPLLATSSSWDTAVKLLYHAVVTSADTCNSNKSTAEQSWGSAVQCLAAYQALAKLLSGHAIQKDGQIQVSLVPIVLESNIRTVADIFPSPSTERIQSSQSKGPIASKQIFKISIQSIMAVAGVLSRMTLLLHSFENKEDAESSQHEFGTSLGDVIRRTLHDRTSPSFQYCERIVRDVALPWVTCLVRTEGEESFEDALLYAKRAHRILWDAAAHLDKSLLLSSRDDSDNVGLKLRMHAILALLLQNNEKGCPSSICATLRFKNMDHACTFAWKTAVSFVQKKAIQTPLSRQNDLYNFHVNVGDTLDIFAESIGIEDQHFSYIEYCSNRAIHMGIQRSASDTGCRRGKECVFRQFTPSFTHHMCLRDPGTITMAVIFLVQHVRQEIDSILNQSKEYYRCQGEKEHDYRIFGDLCDSIIHRFRSAFFLAKDIPSYDLRLRCYRILSLLSLHRLVFNVLQQTDPLIATCIDDQQRKMLIRPCQLIGRFLSECVGPLAAALSADVSIKSSTTSKTSPTHHEVAVECYIRTVSLFDRLHSWVLEQSLCERGEQESRTFAEFTNDTVIALYCFVMGLLDNSNSQLSHRSTARSNLIEKAAKTLAGIGRRRFERQEYSEALLPLVYSANLFVQLTTEPTSLPNGRNNYQLPIRFAHIASIFQTLGMLDHASVAYLAAIVHESFETLDTSYDDDRSFKPLQAISHFTTGVFLIGSNHSEAKNPSRPTFVSRLVSLASERYKSPSTQDPSQQDPSSNLSLIPSTTLVGMLIASVEKPSLVTDELGGFKLSDLIQITVLGSSMRDQFDQYDETDVAIEKLNILLETLVHLGTEIQQRTSLDISQNGSPSHADPLLKEFEDTLQIAICLINTISSFPGGSAMMMMMHKATLNVVAANSLISSLQHTSIVQLANSIDSSKLSSNECRTLYLQNQSRKLTVTARGYLQKTSDTIENDVHYPTYTVLHATIDMFYLDLPGLTLSEEAFENLSMSVLSQCTKAVNLLSTVHDSGKISQVVPQNLASTLSRTLSRLEVSFIARGDNLHAAQVANLALHLVGNATMEEKLWHCAIIGSSLMKAGLCSLAKEFLYRSDLKLQVTSKGWELPNLEKITPHLLIEIEMAVVRLCFRAPIDTGDDLIEIERVENMLKFLSDTTGESRLLVQWVRCTCCVALADTLERRGDIVSSLLYLRSGIRICQSALSMKGQPKGGTEAPSSYRILLLSLPTRFVERRIDFLKKTALSYARLGDYRKSEAYILSAADFSQLQLQTQNKSSKMKFCEILSSDVSAIGTPQQLACYRMVLELKAIASAPDVVAEELMQGGRMPDILRTSSNAIAHDGSKLHWNIEEIWNRITHGDLLQHGSYIPLDNGYVRLHQSAKEYYDEIVSTPMVESSLMSLSTFKIPHEVHFRYFDTLSCTLKLREAQLLLSNCEFGVQRENGKSLCIQITQSPYAPMLCRAQAFYYLGLAELETARRNGKLASLWHHYSVVSKSSSKSDDGVKKEVKDDSCIYQARFFFNETLSILGTATQLLARNAMRSLALVVGPIQNSDEFDSSCAVLIHTSIGSTSRQFVSNAYAFDRSSRQTDMLNGACSSQDFSEQPGEIFAALDSSFKNSSARKKKVERLFKEANRLLPPNWRFLAATLCPTGEILLTSAEACPSTNVLSLLDTYTVCIFPGTNPLDFHRNVLLPLDDVIGRSQEHLRGMSATAAANEFSEASAKKNWWKERQSIDDELQSLLKLVEHNYFGSECIQSLFKVTDNEIKDASILNSLNDCDNSLDLSCDNLASKFEAACMIDIVEPPIQQADARVEKEPRSRKVLEKMTVPQIKEELIDLDAERAQLRKLRKSELIDLLMDILQQRSIFSEQSNDSKREIEEKTNDTTNNKIGRKVSQQNDCLFLILDEHLHRFPFEGMQFLHQKAVSRIPSLPFVVAALSESESLSQERPSDGNITNIPIVDPVGVSYVVDPEANLNETNKRLVPAIEKLHSASDWKWKGVVGTLPSLQFVEEALTRKNGLFLYCGHGGGQSFFSRAQVNKLLHGENLRADRGLVNTAAMNSYKSKRRCHSSIILMGCSSGKLESVNRKDSKSSEKLPIFYEPEGIVLSYLSAGAPCVVGNLWDVTDRDIDRYCLELLQKFLSPNKVDSMAQCVADARSACKMKYIVGCAPVCYGVPVYVRSV